MTRMRLLALGLLVGTLFAGTAIPARAQASSGTTPEHPLFTDRFHVEVGGWFVTSTTEASLSGPEGGAGVVISFEDTLGLEDRQWNPVGKFAWRFGERWRLDAEYFAWGRDATRVLETDVEWGGDVYPVGTTVASTFDFSDTRVSAGWSFFRRPDKELGIGVGLHAASFDASLDASGIGTNEGDVLAPLPVLSVYGAFALTDRWALSFRTDWLSLESGDYGGDVRSSRIDVVYQPFRHVGFNLGLDTLVVNVTTENEDWVGEARTVYYGPMLGARFSF